GSTLPSFKPSRRRLGLVHPRQGQPLEYQGRVGTFLEKLKGAAQSLCSGRCGAGLRFSPHSLTGERVPPPSAGLGRVSGPGGEVRLLLASGEEPGAAELLRVQPRPQAEASRSGKPGQASAAGPHLRADGRRWQTRRPPGKPRRGPLVYFLQQVDRILSKVSPFAAAGIVVGTLYWSAVTYGAVTVMQVVGHKKGLDVMERADPLFLLMGLPTIPVMLVLGKMIRWEDYVLRVWRKYSSKLQALQALVPGISCPVPHIPLAESRYQSDHLSISRTLCGALVFPTIANLVGRVTFRRVNSSLQRTILGGIAFVALKGALKVYFRQQQYLIQANRRILNFVEKGDMERNSTPLDEDSGSEAGLS
uniref:E3 ubiquitin-protein ligase MARCH5-like n=1 Tax=Podarcis muralis TaxID=64176 RepID=A0A670J6B3_PODMU